MKYKYKIITLLGISLFLLWFFVVLNITLIYIAINFEPFDYQNKQKEKLLYAYESIDIDPIEEEIEYFLYCNIDYNSYGISDSDSNYVDFIVYHESGCDYNAVNYNSLEDPLPRGMCQLKMSEELFNSLTKNEYSESCIEYMEHRYENWYDAYIFWNTNFWW